ncbi:hypothetical protein, partial [Neobacillus mesonae]|uniref:hypothetical protein n=1 Tax=Neobacillus mesonae TaxID=1193713 RepID=UPI002E2389E5|nr:hypothetical protein [Neobacillus mesonae]
LINFTLARIPLYIIEEIRCLLFVDVFVCLVFKEQFIACLKSDKENDNIFLSFLQPSIISK